MKKILNKVTGTFATAIVVIVGAVMAGLGLPGRNDFEMDFAKSEEPKKT